MTLRLNEEKISAKTSVLVYTQVENGNEYTSIAAVYDADKGEKEEVCRYPATYRNFVRCLGAYLARAYNVPVAEM